MIINDPTSLAPLFPALPGTAGRRAAFRLPRHMHVPAHLIALEFSLEPDLAWLARSFMPWLRPPPTAEPAWMH